MKNFEYFYGNKPYKSNTEIVINNPENNSPVGFAYGMNKSDIVELYKKAHHAFTCYRLTPLLERVKKMRKWAQILRERADELANLMVLEIAKNFNSSKKEVIRSAEYIEYTIEEYLRMHPQCYNSESVSATDHRYGIFERVPLGVILAIPPFNYPVNLAVSKLAPALITGNTVVMKPPTAGTLTSTLLAKTLHDAGFDNYIFNLAIIRGRDAGDVLVNNDIVKVVNFTGSSQIGHQLARDSHFATLIGELGGKDPALVLKDADCELAANKIVAGAFNYSGQRCTAIKRVFVHSDSAECLIDHLKTNINKLTVGSAASGAAIAHVIDSNTVQLVKKLVADATNKGAKVLLGNKYEGNLIYPTLVDNVTPDMDLAWVEPFAPILPILRVDDYDEMIKLANMSEYGLQASLFTNNLDLALSLGKKLDVGTVHVNSFSERGPDYFPFTGVKQSGINVQGIKNALLTVTTSHGIVLHYRD